MHKPWSITTKRIVVIGAAFLLFAFVNRVGDIWSPVIVALILAYILKPIVDFMSQRLRMPRTLAVAIVYLGLIALIILVTALLVPPIISQIEGLVESTPDFIQELGKFIDKPLTIGQLTIDLDRVYEQASGAIEGLISTAAARTINILSTIAEAVVLTIFVLVASFYLVKDSSTILQWVDEATPPGFRQDAQRLRRQIAVSWNAFLRGQIILCVVMGIIVGVTMALVGMPNALIIGLMFGVLEFIPNLGPTIASIPTLIIAFAKGSTVLDMSNVGFTVLILVINTALQQLENSFLVPRILGQSLNLHPLVVLIAAIIGARLAGVLGILLAAPTVATLRILAEYTYRRLLDMPPFPENALADHLDPSSALTIRAARIEDKADIDAFCAQIWNGEDYVPEAWSHWLADPTGQLSIAILADQPIALSKLTRLAANEWWLEGLRVDLAFQNKGVAGKLHQHNLALAKQLGGGSIRLATSSKNSAVHILAHRTGFRLVARYTPHKAGGDPTTPNTLRPVNPTEAPQVWKLLKASTRLQGAQIYEDFWTWQTLTETRLNDLIAAGQVLGLQDLRAVAFVSQTDPKHNYLRVGLLDGNQTALSEVARSLCRLAADQGYAEGVSFKSLEEPALLTALQQAGYESSWENQIFVFEK